MSWQGGTVGTGVGGAAMPRRVGAKCGARDHAPCNWPGIDGEVRRRGQMGGEMRVSAR